MSVLFLDGLCKSKILICTVLILFQSRGRAFLNVVDVHASSILRDIREHDKAKEDEEDEAFLRMARRHQAMVARQPAMSIVRIRHFQ